MEDENICDSCKFCDEKSDKKPCNVCMQFIDGYLEPTQYEPKGWD